ncbi:hypothetical protein [Archangium sp.]|jgi:hypothetical protein|uniref:hypothetical protein n=1 Tax=Archangium sp. TaxID=1872627 RepID=UPI002EDA4F36
MPHFNVHLDREASERAGAGGWFQVNSITDEHGKDCTRLLKIDQGKHYPDLASLAADIAEALGIAPKDVYLEEVGEW